MADRKPFLLFCLRLVPQKGDIPQLLPHQGCEHRTVNNGRITDKIAPHRFTDLPGRRIERQTQQIVSNIPNCEGQAEAVLGFSDFRKIFPLKPFQQDTAAQRLGGLGPAPCAGYPVERFPRFWNPAR